MIIVVESFKKVEIINDVEIESWVKMYLDEKCLVDRIYKFEIL